MIRSRRVLPLVGVLASVMLVWSATAGLLWNADTPQALQDAKFAGAERLVFYRVDAGQKLTLRLPAGAQSLRVVTHLVLPEGTSYAPDRQYLYGFDARILSDDGQTLLHKPLFTRTRQSKGSPAHGTWLKEASFTTGRDTQITDEREFVFEPPPELRASPATFSLEYPGPEGALLVRAYARMEQAPPLLRNRESRRVIRAEARAQKATFEPWEKLSSDTQQELIDQQWQRLDAEGEPGRDFLTQPVYRTPFRLPLVEVNNSDAERLEQGRAIAVNVMGPVRLVVWLWRAPGEDAHGTLGPVRLTTQSPNAEAQPLELAVPVGEPARHTFDVPAGPQTVTLFNAGSVDLRYTVEGPRYAWLAPETLKGRGAAQMALVPDVRRFEAHVTGPGCPAIELEVGELPDDAARLLRLDARVLSHQQDGSLTQVKVTLLDEKGQPLGDGSFDASNTDAPWEAVDLANRTGDQLPCSEGSTQIVANTQEVTNRPIRVGEVSSARVFLRPGTRTLRVQTSVPTAIQLSSYLAHPEGSALEAPYADALPAGMRWRNAPVENGSWHPLRPINRAELESLGAAVTVLGQVRLERRGEDAHERAPTGEAISLFPWGAPATREVLEPDALTLEEGSSDPLRALYTRVLPNQPVKLSFASRTPSRPELRLELDPTALGQWMQVMVDGEPVRRFRPQTTRVRQLLPPIPPGAHEIVLQAEVAEGTAIWGTVNRAPAPGESATPLRLRTVYRLSDDVRVQVKKPSREPVTLNVVVYSPEVQPTVDPRVAITIGNGKPKRTMGILVPWITRAERSEPLPPSTRDAAVPMGDPQLRWYPRTIPVTLGEDIAPGVHTIRVRAIGNHPLWARFFIYGHDESTSGPRQWNRPGWDQEDAP